MTELVGFGEQLVKPDLNVAAKLVEHRVVGLPFVGRLNVLVRPR